MTKYFKIPTAYFAFCSKGAISIIIQTLIIRELLIVFSGNELTIAIILANWILLESIGSGLLAKFKLKNSQLTYILCQISISLILPLVIVFIRDIKNILGILPQESLGIGYVFIISFIILAPFCLVDGFMFPAGSRFISGNSKKPGDQTDALGKNHIQRKKYSAYITRVYIFEAIGVLIGAPIFTFFLLPYANSLNISFILSIINLISSLGLIVCWYIKGKIKFILSTASLLSIILAISLISSGFVDKLQNFYIQRQFKGFQIIKYKNSIYENLSIGKRQGQLTYFLNGIPAFTLPNPDLAFAQKIVHFPLLIHKNPKKILLIGRAQGVINEILKHRVDEISYIEIDPLIISTLKEYAFGYPKEELKSSKLKIKIADARKFIKHTQNTYDVILINLSEPSSIQINRFYTKEFFIEAKDKLSQNGILSFHLPGSLSYYSDELKKINLNILNTLKSCFPFVKVIPGQINIFCASKSNINLEAKFIISQFEKRNIKTSLITADYLKYRLGRHYFDWFKKSLENLTAGINRDIKPLAVFYTISWWNSKFYPHSRKFFSLAEKANVWIILSSIILILLVAFFKTPNKKDFVLSYLVSTTGLSGIILSIILIIFFQSFYGYVYSKLALLSGFFMAGISSGAILSLKKLIKWRKDSKIFIKAEGLLIFISTLIGLLALSPYLKEYMFYLLAALAGIVAGIEFPLANDFYLIDKTSVNAGFIYSMDLIGSFLGALFCGFIFIPLYGIVNTIILIIIIKTASIFFLSFGRINHPARNN